MELLNENYVPNSVVFVPKIYYNGDNKTGGMVLDMKDTRKSIKVAPVVKAEIEAIRKELEVKTESHALAYLAAMYWDQKNKKILLGDHQKYKQSADEANDQKSI
ncbi:hypothetical protein [Acinetobacter baumannii]|uniref:hypothetical protein n=1 Tax=Acinetobacter baumannii TaxID=470 RepID=UPI002B23CEF3|nr:hypothetical protein [Acinetobacter baumannii]